MHYFMSRLVCNHLEEEERADRFAFIVLRISWRRYYPVSLLHSAMGWSVVSDCCISWYYSLNAVCTYG